WTQQALLTPETRRYFRGSRETYSLWIAGTRIYICSSPEDVASLLGNTTTVANPNLINLMRWLGVSEEGVTRFFQVDPAAQHDIGTGKPQAPVSMMDGFHRRQLKSGPLVEDLIHRRLLPEVDRTLKNLEDDAKPSADGISESLLRICIDMFIGGAITAFLGDQIRESCPALVSAFITWERTCWKWAFKMPAVLSRDMLQARDGMVNAFVGYLDIPADDRQDAAYFIKATEAMLRDVGICDTGDIARILVVQFFNILSNVYKAAFWTIAYLLYKPSLVERIRSEIAPTIKDGQVQDEAFLSGSCPLLDSLMSESFRLTIASSLSREVVGPTPVKDKILQPGSVLMFPIHQLHFDPSVWGPDPRAMDPSRFAQDPKLYASRSYRPFGGGHSLCPARFFVRRIIGYAVASLVTKFDVDVDIERTRQKVGTKRPSGEQAQTGPAKGIESINFPRVDLSKPSPGASLPVVQGEDVYLVLKRASP
ncbi:cytochrome P450, partial [Apiospora arundinis]